MIVGPTSTTPASAPLYLMELADRRADWAAVRQAAIAGNVANADTPDYRARDIEPFTAASGGTRFQLATTRPDHLAMTPLAKNASEVEESRSWDVAHSGNTVSVDEELAKSAETQRSHNLALTVRGAFHRMLMQSVTAR